VVSFDTDWLYPTAESRAIVHALNAAAAPVSFVELSAPFGHDSFLLDVPALDRVMRASSDDALPPGYDCPTIPRGSSGGGARLPHAQLLVAGHPARDGGAGDRQQPVRRVSRGQQVAMARLVTDSRRWPISPTSTCSRSIAARLVAGDARASSPCRELQGLRRWLLFTRDAHRSTRSSAGRPAASRAAMLRDHPDIYA
jgi:hypothetical protein